MSRDAAPTGRMERNGRHGSRRPSGLAGHSFIPFTGTDIKFIALRSIAATGRCIARPFCLRHSRCRAWTLPAPSFPENHRGQRQGYLIGLEMFFRRRKDRSEGHSWFGLHEPFDPKYRLVTSGLVQPWVLFIIRLVLAIYSLATSLAHLIIYTGVQRNPGDESVLAFDEKLPNTEHCI